VRGRTTKMVAATLAAKAKARAAMRISISR
jgi:hypothetical protein